MQSSSSIVLQVSSSFEPMIAARTSTNAQSSRAFIQAAVATYLSPCCQNSLQAAAVASTHSDKSPGRLLSTRLLQLAPLRAQHDRSRYGV
jgi:hypothetical protein